MSTADQVAADLKGLADLAIAAVVDAVTDEGNEVLADVKKRAARPRTAPSVAGLGPRLQTGTYNRSINMRPVQTTAAGKVTASVGTNKIQGYRLEKGFDEPGKHTLPHPHFGPALDTSEGRFPDRLAAALRGTIK